MVKEGKNRFVEARLKSVEFEGRSKSNFEKQETQSFTRSHRKRKSESLNYPDS